MPTESIAHSAAIAPRATASPANARRGVRRKLLAVYLAASMAVLLLGCESGPRMVPPPAVDFDQADVCELTGLRPYDHPGPKGQIHFRDRDRPVFYCDTVEMMHVFLAEPDPRRILAIYTQDAGRTDWFEPRGGWMDARSAVFVAGSSRIGPLGSTLAPFSSALEADAFITEFGGEQLRFSDITPDRVALDGGALHDTSM